MVRVLFEVIEEEIVGNNEAVIIVLENGFSDLGFVEPVIVHVLNAGQSPQSFFIQLLVFHARVLIENLNVERHVLAQPGMQSQLMKLNSLDRIRSQHSLYYIMRFW